MANFKWLSSIFLFFILIFSVNAEVFNSNGDFTISIDSLKNQVYNDNIQTTYSLNIKNNRNYRQRFDLELDKFNGWDININPDSFSLNGNEEIDVLLEFKANSEFNYATNVRSPDTIVISQKTSYIGFSEFPLKIVGDNQEVSLNLQLDIRAKEKQNEIYTVEFPTRAVSPVVPLNFAVRGSNIFEEQKVLITLNFAGEKFTFNEVFNEKNNYFIYDQKVPSIINPGIYDAKVVIRLERSDSDVAWEWDSIKQVEVSEYVKIDEKLNEDRSFFIDKTEIQVTNLGNVKQEYNKILDVNFIKKMLISSNIDYEKTNEGLVLKTDLEKGESKIIKYSFNYIPLYIFIIIVIVISSYIFIRKNSNPLDVEVNLYEIKKVKHEGVKQLKVKIGFENIKENEIDNLSIIFRMPKYLNIKDSSFLLTPPNHVLKGTDQYKLSWDFKRFEKDETRILGFTLVNARGILGDIKIPDLEIEIKNKGKIKRYYKSIPLIKG